MDVFVQIPQGRFFLPMDFARLKPLQDSTRHYQPQLLPQQLPLRSASSSRQGSAINLHGGSLASPNGATSSGGSPSSGQVAIPIPMSPSGGPNSPSNVLMSTSTNPNTSPLMPSTSLIASQSSRVSRDARIMRETMGLLSYKSRTASLTDLSAHRQSRQLAIQPSRLRPRPSILDASDRDVDDSKEQDRDTQSPDISEGSSDGEAAEGKAVRCLLDCTLGMEMMLPLEPPKENKQNNIDQNLDDDYDD